MKLAEALTARADLQRRIEQLRARITANARYQEGEEPAEDAAALLGEAEADLGSCATSSGGSTGPMRASRSARTAP